MPLRPPAIFAPSSKRAPITVANKEMTFLEHLEELRWTLMRSAVVILAAMLVAFFWKELVFDTIILAPRDPGFITYRALCALSQRLGLGDALCIRDLGFELQNISMSGQFLTHLKVSFVAGLVAASPYVLWEVWRFIAPGLNERERRAARSAVVFAGLLFLLGVTFGYYVIAPMSIQFLGGYKVSEAVRNTIALDSFIGTMTSVPLWTGVMFQLPLAVLMLARLGLMSAAVMRTYRRHAFVGILVVAAVITPPDVTSQILVSLPLLALYEVSILLAARVERQALAAEKPRTPIAQAR
ncbi:MAG: twin-arginine translocase subunit TatC [Flavobacteriales bacterium]|nr:twin-arginine translocase subunit TatC [Flavobacteriales bacterium]MBK7942453.1 twin-arginine translocase subunit TatC [Flavobacteriales bacterium]MBK8948269.1 twin-arginine translocase subunit TatC [Flavobacteriales bacterium]MBK9699148.1 twin-arginine translocase subunit TatC [Flavobacteriales bacterium]